jgi:hypothetical protein
MQITTTSGTTAAGAGTRIAAAQRPALSSAVNNAAASTRAGRERYIIYSAEIGGWFSDPGSRRRRAGIRVRHHPIGTMRTRSRAPTVAAMTYPTRQLLAYNFGPGSSFEGQLVGALERIESGGAMRILDALFVARQPESGELVAVSLSADGSAGMIGRLISFRLDESARKASTRRVLDGPAGDMVRSLAEGLQPGNALAAVLVEHKWALTLGEAITRMGGSEAVNEFVEGGVIGDVASHLSAV